MNIYTFGIILYRQILWPPNSDAVYRAEIC